MKKYIGLTIYFVWLVLLSYTFFYFSNKSKDIKQIVTYQQKEKMNDSWSEKLDLWKKDDNSSWNNQQVEEKSNDVLSGIDNLQVVANTWEEDTVLKETSDESTWSNNQYFSWNDTLSSVIPDKIYVWLADAKLVSGSNYDDVFTLFNVDKYPTYKVSWKEIYFKQLKSIDYNTEKNNIDQLIQEIWGNIVETNLFWDKQLFVNPDLYYKKVVIMLVSYDWKVYFVTLPYSKYQKYKPFLKNVLFVNS